MTRARGDIPVRGSHSEATLAAQKDFGASMLEIGSDQESAPITASMRFFIVEASNGLMM